MLLRIYKWIFVNALFCENKCFKCCLLVQECFKEPSHWSGVDAPLLGVLIPSWSLSAPRLGRHNVALDDVSLLHHSNPAADSEQNQSLVKSNVSN